MFAQPPFRTVILERRKQSCELFSQRTFKNVAQLTRFWKREPASGIWERNFGMLVIVPSRKILPRERRFGKVPKEIPPHPFGAFCSARSSPPKKFASLEDDTSKWDLYKHSRLQIHRYRRCPMDFFLKTKPHFTDIHNRRTHSLQTKKELSCQQVLGRGFRGNLLERRFPLTHPP